jgi:uncharacterized membrane protein
MLSAYPIAGGILAFGIILFFILANRFNSRKPQHIDDYKEKVEVIRESAEPKRRRPRLDGEPELLLGSLLQLIIMLIGIVVVLGVGESILTTVQDTSPTAYNSTTSLSDQLPITDMLSTFGSFIPGCATVILAAVIISLILSGLNFLGDNTPTKTKRRKKKMNRRKKKMTDHIEDYKQRRDKISGYEDEEPPDNDWDQDDDIDHEEPEDD